ncbi:MAG: protein kinase [Bryobacteraceae bacterium]|nr:protein kinase [Bryobacteraceae bacterium]
MKHLFSTAVDLPAAQRAEFIRRETVDTPELAAQVFRLLALDPDAEDAIDRMGLPGELLDAAARRNRHFPGERLASRYEIRRFLAAGGSGEVYEAEDLERGERIAIKSLAREIPKGDQLAWLRREVGAARRVSHRNVARVYDLVQSDETVFLTMELLSGETLAARLKQQGAMSCREAMPLVRQMVAGLAAAHAAGVVHRDLKPGNVMIVPRPDGPPRVVLTDFGLARPTPEDPHATVRASSQAMGTPAYMAPEQVLGRAVTPAADIYALGVVLYEMLTGITPFAEESALTMAVRKTQGKPRTPAVFAPGLRPGWARAILRCLEPDPRRRFRSVGDLLAALEARSVAGQSWRLAKRWGARAVRWWRPGRVVAALAVALVLAVGWGWWRPAPTARGRQVWEQGLASLQAGYPVLAAQWFEKGLAEERLPERAALDLALAWHRAGFPQRAQSALPSRRWWGDALYGQAVRAQLAGQTKEALQLIRQRAGEHPRDAEAVADLADWEPSGGAWRRVLQLRPNHLAAHLRLAATSQDPLEAERHYLVAETLAGAGGNQELARAVGGQRGLARLRRQPGLLAAGVLEALRAEVTSGAGPCERKMVLQEGDADDFALPPDAMGPLSPRLEAMRIKSGESFRHFDERRDNRPFAVSFALPRVRICAAQLVLKVRHSRDLPNASNDAVMVGLAPFDQHKLTIPLWAKDPMSESQVVVVDLSHELFGALQLSYPASETAWLDFYLSDDTDLDYAKLTLVY